MTFGNILEQAARHLIAFCHNDSQWHRAIIDRVELSARNTVPEARHSNLRHRPVGLGIMGYQDALYAMAIPFASEAAVTM